MAAPGDSPEDIARGLRADVDEIAKFCVDLAGAGFIERMTWLRHPGGHGPLLR